MVYCSNCGTSMADNAIFCPECGAKTEKTVAVETISTSPSPENVTQPLGISPAQSMQSTPQATAGAETNSAQAASRQASVNQTGKDIQHFLKVSLPDLTKKILFDPLDGTKKILTEIKEPAKIGLYCILICSLIISLLIYLRIPPELSREMNFFEYFFRAFTLPVLGAFVITFFSFVIKAINNSQKANFGNEILTGGIVSIGYAVFFILAFLLSYILKSSFNNSTKFNSFGNYGRVSNGPPIFSIIIIFSLFIYLFTITSNSLSQSLRSSGIKDVTAFYLSPFLVIISAYLTIRLWIALFGGKNDLGFNDIFNFL